MNTLLRIVLPAVIAIPLPASVVYACPNCKESAVEIIPGRDGPMMKTDLDAPRGAAFNSSIILMLTGVALSAGSLGFFVVKAGRVVTAQGTQAE